MPCLRQIDRLIRPDIRLYVGQSGSALINEQRQVLGINSPVLARQAVITIPVQTINRVVDVVLELGHVPRPFLGIAMQPIPVPDPVREAYPDATDEVLLVTHVEPKAPAALAGVMVWETSSSYSMESLFLVCAKFCIGFVLRASETLSR